MYGFVYQVERENYKSIIFFFFCFHDSYVPTNKQEFDLRLVTNSLESELEIDSRYMGLTTLDSNCRLFRLLGVSTRNLTSSYENSGQLIEI